jgi:membrane protein implicated in regulation of membrane protease activity
MELKAMDIAPYKKAYIGVLFICILSVTASFLIVWQGYAILANIPETKTVKDIIMYSMIGVAAIFSSYQRKQKQKLATLTDFDEKISFYQKIYNTRLWWHVISCVISAFLLFLTARKFFLYLAIFDLVLMLLAFPNKMLFKKELNEEDLIVH